MCVKESSSIQKIKTILCEILLTIDIQESPAITTTCCFGILKKAFDEMEEDGLLEE